MKSTIYMWASRAITNGQYMIDNIYIEHRRSYHDRLLLWAQKKLSWMDNTWRDTIYIEHRRSYQEWTIHDRQYLQCSTEEAIKNGQYMIDIEQEEAIMNGQYMKRYYLHWSIVRARELSRMDNTWWASSVLTLSYCHWAQKRAIKNGQYMKRQYLHWAQKKLSRMDNTW